MTNHPFLIMDAEQKMRQTLNEIREATERRQQEVLNLIKEGATVQAAEYWGNAMILYFPTPEDFKAAKFLTEEIENVTITHFGQRKLTFIF